MITQYNGKIRQLEKQWTSQTKYRKLTIEQREPPLKQSTKNGGT